MKSWISLTLILVVIILVLNTENVVRAQEDRGFLASEQPTYAVRNNEEEDRGFGDNPTGGKNVYCYMLFILLTLATVFLAFRGNKKT